MSGIVALLNSISKSASARYAVALGATLVALLIRLALHLVLGDHLSYITLFPAVALSAWFCGVAPSVVSVIFGLVCTRYWFVAPEHSLGMPDSPGLTGMLGFLVASTCIVAIGEISRRNNEELRNAQGALEEKVRQRTAELDKANQSLSELTGRLLKLQDEERRRIARELHDSVGQTLAALAMNLSTVKSEIERVMKTASTVADSVALVDDMSTDIRTISYLLHPPLLDETGLSHALRWYIEGFAARSGIDVKLEFPADFGRLPQDLETAIFRVVQECLTNIHRHSESPVAKVRVEHSATDVRIEVEDEGKGMSPARQLEISSSGIPGVGLRGMRERLRQLGGSLEIKSDGEGKGTTVVAHLPVAGTPKVAAAAASAGASEASTAHLSSP